MIVGHDISSLPQVEETGRTFSDEQGTAPLERILARHSATHVRLRLWVDPPPGWYCDLPYTLAMARRVKDAGLALLLDFHYCDHWADPGKQPVPGAWANQDVSTLAGTVRAYTASVLEALARQGTPAEMVQIGNEITNGMLWPQGQIYVDGEERWDEFTMLLNAGIDGARSADPAAQIMVHIDRGGDNAGSTYFFDRIMERGAEFDLMGLSYYPWWHGPLEALEDNLRDLAVRYGKDIILVEAAYPRLPINLDHVGDVGGPRTALPSEFPPTPKGQLAFLKRLDTIVRETPHGRGAGLTYWEPAWLKGTGTNPNIDPGWAAMSLFDHEGHALPGLDWPSG